VSTVTKKERQAIVNGLAQDIGRRLATKTVLFHSALAAKLGLSATDLKCLDLLREADPPLTATELAERAGLTGGAITGVTDRLEAGGFVERVRDSDDRRRWEIRPIATSRKVVVDLFAPIRDAMAGICAPYSDAELKVIADFLQKLGLALDEAAEQLRDLPPA
jgi:DNA-binding MarR family transcriptional regulator